LGASRVPAIDDVGVFFLPQLRPGTFQLPERQPVVNAAMHSAATTSEQREIDLRMVPATFVMMRSLIERQGCLGTRTRDLFPRILDTTSFC
jgi:hypothetical protein